MPIKKQNKKKKGFTLIELIIVIAIIAILAAIAIPNFLSIQRKSRVKADIASAKTIYDATSALIAEGKIIPNNSAVTFTLDGGKTQSVTPSGQSSTTTTDQTFVLEKEKKSGSDSTLADDNIVEKYLQTIPVSQSVSGDVFAVKVDPNGKPASGQGESAKAEEPAKIEVYLVKSGAKDTTGGILVYPTTTGDYALNSTN